MLCYIFFGVRKYCFLQAPSFQDSRNEHSVSSWRYLIFCIKDLEVGKCNRLGWRTRKQFVMNTLALHSVTEYVASTRPRSFLAISPLWSYRHFTSSGDANVAGALATTPISILGLCNWPRFTLCFLRRQLFSCNGEKQNKKCDHERNGKDCTSFQTRGRII